MEKKEGKSQCEVEENKANELSGPDFKKFVNKLVFGNPLIWILAVSNFCIYVVRFTILDWGTTFLTQFKGMEISAAGTVVAVSELFGGILGMLVAGWFTDKFMHSKAHRTCLICFQPYSSVCQAFSSTDRRRCSELQLLSRLPNMPVLQPTAFSVSSVTPAQ